MIIPNPSPSGRRFRPERIIAALLALALLVLACAGAVDDATLAERANAVRVWGFLVAAICGIALPHILFPDKRLHMVQVANPPAALLFRYQAWRLRWFAGGLAFTYLIFAFYDPVAPLSGLAAKATLLVEGYLFLSGVLWYSLASYSAIGERSQQWAEGTKGGWYRSLNQTMPLFLVPVGLVPSMFVTGRIVAVGCAAIILAGAGGAGVEWLAGLLPLVLSAVRTPGLLRRYDRHFYHTSAFYDEAFRATGSGAAGDLRVLPYDATYWVPSRWRTNVWGSLTQLDRRLPMGRVMIPSLLLFWGLHLREFEPGTINAFLALLLVAKNCALYMTVTPQFAPLPFQAAMGTALHWWGVRFFMNMKWTFPLAAALAVVVFFSDRHGIFYLLGWTGLDLLLALVSALILTYLHEFQFRKQYS